MRIGREDKTGVTPAPQEPVLLVVPVFSPLCNLAFALRRAVFVEEQGIPEKDEFDAHDLTALHVVAVAQGAVVATLRLIRHAEAVQISRLAVRRDCRGRGWGGKLLTFALARAREAGLDRAWLNAQADKTGFYVRYGFLPEGGQFIEDGLPHRRMCNFRSSA